MKLSAVSTALTAYFSDHQILLPDSLQKALLFGSFARGEAQVGSDVDIALVAQDTWDFARRNQLRDWLEDFDVNLSIHPFFTTSEKLTQTQDKFDANYWIAQEGVVLWQR